MSDAERDLLDTAIPPTARRDDDAGSEMIASAEHLHVGARWQPYEQVRLRRIVRHGEVTRRVHVQWEDLEMERVALRGGTATPSDDPTGVPGADAASREEDIVIVLMREEVVTQTRLVPYRRVRVHRGIIEEDTVIHERLRHEQLDVEQLPQAAPDPSVIGRAVHDGDITAVGPLPGEGSAVRSRPAAPPPPLPRP